MFNVIRMRYGILPVVVSLLLMLGGCSVFVSTPRETRIQIHGMDDQLREYIVRLEDPAAESLNIHLTDRYILQFDFEWLWNTEDSANIYTDLNGNYGDTGMAPWMLCKYRF